MSKASIHRYAGARARTLCFSLLAVAITMPRGCCLTPASAAADSREPGVVAWPPAAPTAVAAPEVAASTAALEAPDVARLRAVRSRQAQLGSEIRRLHDEQRRLAIEDRDRYPITLPLVSMGVGTGVAGYGLSMWFLGNLDLGHSSYEPPREFQVKTLSAAAAGGAWALLSLGVVRYRLNHRAHREEIRALRLERRELQRDMRRLDRDAWSVLPDLSPGERRVGMRVRHVF